MQLLAKDEILRRVYAERSECYEKNVTRHLSHVTFIHLGCDSATLCLCGYTVGLGYNLACWTISGTASSHSTAMMCTPEIPLISLTCSMTSRHILMPSSFPFLAADAAVMRFITSSGTSIPGTLCFMCFAMPADLSGATPARINAFSWSPMSVTIFIHSLNFGTL